MIDLDEARRLADSGLQPRSARDLVRALADEVERLRERVGMATHFELQWRPAPIRPGSQLVIRRVEIGRSGKDRLFRVVGFIGEGPFAELAAMLLGSDGKWHQRPDEENEGFGALTGFPDADFAFAALRRLEPK